MSKRTANVFSAQKSPVFEDFESAFSSLPRSSVVFINVEASALDNGNSSTDTLTEIRNNRYREPHPTV